MFWGLVLEPAKKYTQRVNQTFHISQAALDLKSADQQPVQLVLEYENSNFVLANLSKSANIFQVPLDLMFKVGDQVSFRIIGNGKVHLSGYHILEDLDNILEKGEEESDYDEEMEEIDDVKKKRKKISIKGKVNKKAKLDNENEDDFNEQDEDEDDDNDEDEDDDDDLDENEEESEEQVVAAKKSKQTKKGKQSNVSKLSTDDDLDEDEDEDLDDDDYDEEEDDEELEFEDDDEEEEEEEDEEIEDSDEEKTKSFKMENKKTPNGIASAMGGKAKNLNKSKNEIKKQITPNREKKSPNTEKKIEKHMKVFDGESTPHKKNIENIKAGDKTPKSPKTNETPQKRVLEGGVICEDIKMGSGPVAKPGKLVNVYYAGSLSSTKKQFDSVQSGPGFKFRLGKNEVIKGWDIGVNGMKVGGTRKLTIPAHLAYGAKGSPPVIPPHSTLVFTVELKGVS